MRGIDLMIALSKLPAGFDVVIESSGDEYPPRQIRSIEVVKGRILVSSQEQGQCTLLDDIEE